MNEPIRLKCRDCAVQSNCQRKVRKQRYDSAMKTYCSLGVKTWPGTRKSKTR
jgi:hypothetical protein